MAPASKDLFDDSTMSFGDHLEELRRRLFKAIIGLVLCIGVTLYFGSSVVSAVRSPIDNALKKHNLIAEETEAEEGVEGEAAGADEGTGTGEGTDEE